MKIENFEQIKKLMDQLEKYNKKLEALDCEVDVLIVYSNSGSSRIYTIGTDSTCEHEYQKPAAQLIETVKDDLKSRIENIKSTLEPL